MTNKTVAYSIIALIVSSFSFYSPLLAHTNNSNNIEQEQINHYVKTFEENPPLFEKIAVAFSQKMDQKRNEDRAAKVKEHLRATPNILSSIATFTIGDGKKTTYAFVSPGCPHCKFLISDILSLNKEGKCGDGKICFLIVGNSKDHITQSLSAAAEMHQFEAFFNKIKDDMEKIGGKEDLLKIAEELGINQEQFAKHMDSKNIQRKIDEVSRIANQFMLDGFPSIVTPSGEVVIGRPPAEKLLNILAQPDGN
ncbi:DsbA family protein [Candidatus Hydrogenosomobacter endosymbioticus]|uniref:DSBA-like thioredoxin domain-containing protein n=1 Tax=Candidatus Hydrogenosomobacter endosymbioticus TaxID=2558174 RepID=A0ABM7V8Z6_9PROT|nr:DsbA family protein [Candidatus Hydrogenosomobacter endosymbioticus]BDB95963.1 hypothetical protein HYD_0960 [Candidatus Hydrogenosomobacter endosymbioticus]